MANLYTYMTKTMKSKTDIRKHYKNITSKIDSILINIQILAEDPLFIDGIHGEQELNLDQTVELFKGIKSQFLPLNLEPEAKPLYESEAIDVS